MRASERWVLLLATASLGATAWPLTATAQAQALRRFDIAAKPLSEALTDFGRQSGLQVSADADAIRGMSSLDVSGDMLPLQALSRLLTGTGFTYRLTGNTVTLERAPDVSGGAMALGPVRVEGAGNGGGAGGNPAPASSVIGTLPPTYAGGKVARGAQLGLLGNQDVFDTPFSVSSYTAETVRDLGARTPLQVLSLDPSVSRATGGTESSDQFIVRGFTAFAFQYTLNGLPGQGGVFGFDAEAYERIELNKGPAALLNGGAASANVGGTVNLVPKKATDEPITRITAQVASGAEGQIAADIGRRFDDGKFGARTNLVYSDGNRNVASNPNFRRLSGTLDLDYRGNWIRAYVHGSLLYRFVDTYNTFTLQPAIVDQPPPRQYRWPSPALMVWEEGIQGGVEVDLAKATTLAMSYGKRWNQTDQAYTYSPTADPTTFQILPDATGSFQQVNGFYGAKAFTTSMIATLRSRLSTGPVSHQLAATVSRTIGQANYRLAGPDSAPFVNNINNLIVGPIVDRGPYGPPASRDQTTSAGIADTVGLFNDRVLITGGLRRVNIQSSGDTGNGQLTKLYDSSATTPAIGVVVKPVSKVSLYGNYIEALEPGQVAPLNGVNGNPINYVSNPGQIFPPTPAKQGEGGVKVDWGKLGLTAALFRIERPSYEINVTTLRFGPIGQQVNKGFEFNLFGELTKRLRFVGGYSYVEARLTKTVDPTVEGRIAGGVPRHTLTGFAEWDTTFLDGFTLTGRFRAQSSQFGDSTDTARAPGKTLVGLGANYRLPIAKPILIRAFVDNVANTRAYVSFSRGRFAPEDPRTFRLSAEVDF